MLLNLLYLFVNEYRVIAKYILQFVGAVKLVKFWLEHVFAEAKSKA